VYSLCWLEFSWKNKMAVGGVIGYFKAGSNQSLIAGGGSALVLCYVYLTLPTKPFLASAIGLGQCLLSPLTWVSMFVSTDVQLRKIYATLFIKQFGAVLLDWQFDSLWRIITRKECAWDITSTGNSRTLDMGLRNDTLFQPDGDTLQIQKSMLTLIYIYMEREREREREREWFFFFSCGNLILWRSVHVDAGVSITLLIVMGSRFWNSGKFFPAGVVSILSLIMAVGYIHALIRTSHDWWKIPGMKSWCLVCFPRPYSQVYLTFHSNDFSISISVSLLFVKQNSRCSFPVPIYEGCWRVCLVPICQVENCIISCI